MRQVFKILATFALAHAAPAFGGVTSGVSSSLYGIRFNPVPSYSAATMGGHGGQVGGEAFLAPRLSLGTGLSYGWMSMANVNKLTSRMTNDREALASAEAASKVSFDSSRERAISVLATRYHGPGDRLFATAGVGFSESEISAHRAGGERSVRRRAVLPEAGYGYQWQYRHGGFVALGGATIYRIPVAEDVRKRGDGDAKVLADATGAGARLYPALRLGIGAFFR